MSVNLSIGTNNYNVSNSFAQKVSSAIGGEDNSISKLELENILENVPQELRDLCLTVLSDSTITDEEKVQIVSKARELSSQDPSIAGEMDSITQIITESSSFSIDISDDDLPPKNITFDLGVQESSDVTRTSSAPIYYVQTGLDYTEEEGSSRTETYVDGAVGFNNFMGIGVSGVAYGSLSYTINQSGLASQRRADINYSVGLEVPLSQGVISAFGEYSTYEHGITNDIGLIETNGFRVGFRMPIGGK